MVLAKALTLSEDIGVGGGVWMTQEGSLTTAPVFLSHSQSSENLSNFNDVDNAYAQNQQQRGQRSNSDCGLTQQVTSPPITLKHPDETHTDSFGNNKWWCAYGHSRRGLEHISDGPEMIDKAGKKRHHLVVGAIRAVIEEQSRQRVEDPTAVLDAGKLGRVSEKMTSWATQLAYKAGLDDEKIVQQIYNSPAVTPPPPPESTSTLESSISVDSSSPPDSSEEQSLEEFTVDKISISDKESKMKSTSSSFGQKDGVAIAFRRYKR